MKEQTKVVTIDDIIRVGQFYEERRDDYSFERIINSTENLVEDEESKIISKDQSRPIEELDNIFIICSECNGSGESIYNSKENCLKCNGEKKLLKNQQNSEFNYK